MNLENYRLGQRYAWTLAEKKDSGDILHDAYLTWYDKKGVNLFDEHPGTVFRVIKYTFLDSLKKNHKYWNYEGQRYTTNCVDFADQICNSRTPEDEYISQELKKNCQKIVQQLSERSNSRINGVKSKLAEVYELMLSGYKNFEISEILGLSRPAITFYANQLKNG